MTGDTQHKSGTSRVLVVAITLLGVSLLAVAVLGMFRPSAEGPFGAPTDEDRGIAIGLMLDTPRTPEVLDEALVLAEKLRRRYGIDTGNDFNDREEAARHAKFEFLDRLVFSEEEILETAASLGYSLDPAECANYCDNVRELATVELQKRALQAFAAGESWPGILSDDELETEVNPLVEVALEDDEP